MPGKMDPQFEDIGTSLASLYFQNSLDIIFTDINDFPQTFSNIQNWADSADGLNLTNFENQLPITTGVDFQASPWDLTYGICCFGTLYDVSVKIIGNMIESRSKLSFSPDQNIHRFDVRPVSEYVMLCFNDGSSFAQVNNLMADALTSIFDLPTVSCVAFANPKSCGKVLSRANVSGQAILKVNINIYGQKNLMFDIGNRLSTKKAFLQDPEQGLEGVEYTNPHIVTYEGIPEPDPNILTLSRRIQGFADSKPSSSVLSKDQISQTASEVYQNLTRFTSLQRLDGEMRVITPLLGHQQTALYFMIQRENGPVPPECSLWDTVQEGTMGLRFVSKFTPHEIYETPFELGGGILADEMGMGKSLSALALICKTLPNGQEWAVGRTEGQHITQPRCAATLIVVPSILIMESWLKEISSRLDSSIRVTKYYGRWRDKNLENYLASDIVITTYHTLATSLERPQSAMFRFEWYRILLDEAHIIRRQATKLNQATRALAARSRWCLTATPIQNTLEDIGSLISFLRISPFENIAVFRKYISNLPIDDPETVKRLASLLDCVCLRRAQNLLDLPGVSNRVRYINFSSEEQHQYDTMVALMSRKMCERAGVDPHGRDFFGIFQAQLQLRIFCNHGTFHKPFLTESNPERHEMEREDMILSLGTEAEFECSSCGIATSVSATLEISPFSKHAFTGILCPECQEKMEIPSSSNDNELLTPENPKVDIRNQGNCGLGKPVGDFHQVRGDSNQFFNPEGMSTKIETLMADIKALEPGTKSIIFSCWTRSLDLITLHLQRLGVRHIRIDGTMGNAQRQVNMDIFTSNEEFPVLLMSTGVGALGLNLTAARNVFILEPQWNPSVEKQAIGRVQRIGQRKGTVVTRYLVCGTVEINISAQQAHKENLYKAGLGASDQQQQG